MSRPYIKGSASDFCDLVRDLGLFRRGASPRSDASLIGAVVPWCGENPGIIAVDLGYSSGSLRVGVCPSYCMLPLGFWLEVRTERLVGVSELELERAISRRRAIMACTALARTGV